MKRGWSERVTSRRINKQERRETVEEGRGEGAGGERDQG